MLKADVKKFYGTYAAIGRAVGISKGGVWMWPERVPQAHAYKLQLISGGHLKVDPSLYPPIRHAKRMTSGRRL